MKAGYLIKHLTGTIVFFLILFLSAGRLNYWQGWVYAGTGIFMGLLSYTFLRIDAGLLAERSKPGEGTKQWDKVILGLAFISAVASYITAGLDSGRCHWSPEFPLTVSLAGALLVFTGQLIFLIAQKQNKFFASTVRIQSDRGQTVCDTGLYKIVRHPGYLGTLLQFIGFPLLTGSLWSIIPVMFSAVLFIVRTAMEDRTLLRELKGYREYAAGTRYRIIPYVW
jgi:protein-S-isoprenylcysteine O-methyltransferase Ste14